MQHHRFGPLVVGAQEEVGLALAGGRRGLGLIGFVAPRRLQDLVDLGGEQLRLPGRRTPSERKIGGNGIKT